MSRLISPAIVVFLVASSSAFGAGAAQSFVTATTELAIDGVSCGRLYSVEGGDPRARSVVVSNPVGTALPKKQIAGVTYAPITVEVALPPAQPILDWISDVCANRQMRKTLLLTKYDVNGQAIGTPLQAINALLTEVSFPAFDAASKDAARLTLVFTPESTKAATVAAATSAGAVKVDKALLSNFKIQIGNLPASRVSRIESFTIKQPVVENAVGESKNIGQQVAAPEFSNLILTINSIDIADWSTWRDNFVVKGMSDDASETNGSLELLAPDMTTLFTLQFSHVGIVRASSLRETSIDAIPKFQAELYCESMAIGTAPAKPLTVMPVAPSTATLAAPPPAATAPVALTPVTTMAPVPAQIATLMPSAASTPASGSAAGGAAAASGNSAAAGGGAAEAAASPAGSAAGGSASAPSASSGAAGGGPAGAAAAPAGGSAAGAAAGSSSGSAASGGGGPAGAAAAPAGGSAAGGAAASSSNSPGAAGGGAAPGSAATTTTTSATDQGARDPKDFPRADGTVRKSYSSVRQKTYSQDIAAYSSKSTPDALEEFYTKSLTAAGWELNTRVENNSSVANTHQIILNWENALRSVTITLAEVKAGGAEIGVNLITTFAP